MRECAGNPLVSIIIPCKTVDAYAIECIEYCRALEYPSLEILILPDQATDIGLDGVRVIPSGLVGPAEKRDLGADNAAGELLAFIDDDAYPEKSWLSGAVGHFGQQQVAAVVGPAVTPGTDGLLQKASGCVYSSFLGSGGYRLRYVPMESQEVDDYPSCNFIVRKSVFEEVGGFSTEYWPGEDTKLCLDLTTHLNKKIVYDPKVLVYHHRRKLFRPHLKQIWNYAVHRGYFARKLPETSRRLSYFLPSLLLLGVVFGIPLSFLNPVIRIAFLSALGVYVGMALVSATEARDMRMVPLIFLGIASTHVVYGMGFMKGLLTRELKV